MSRLVTVLTATAAAAFALAPSANAATTCDFSAGVLSVSMSENFDTTLLAVGSTGGIQVRQQGPVIACTGGAASVTNTNTILVIDSSDNPGTPEGADGRTSLSISRPADFAPGLTQEQGNNAFSEIEFIVNLNDGNDEVTLQGAADRDDWVAGDEGFNFNAGSGDPVPDEELISSPIPTLSLVMGTGNDRFSAQGGTGTGDPYDDGTLQIRGDDGDDTLEGGDAPVGDGFSDLTGNDTLRGFGGNDRFAPSSGDDIVAGGAGLHDLVEFSSAGPVTLDLGVTAPQATGQGTKTISGVEDVQGSNGADTLTGNAAANALFGFTGDDTLDGRGGDDRIEASTGVDTIVYAQAPGGVTADLTAGTATGAAGSDTIADGENLIGSPFADSLTGNALANSIVAGAGIDIVRALAGPDAVDVRDGETDSASCGDDLDTATADQQSVDTVNADCETTSFLAETPVPTPPGGGGGGGGGGGPTPPPAGGPGPRDRTLSFALGGSKTQRVLRKKYVLVTLRCPLEACTTVASGAGRSIRKLKLAPVTKRIGAGAARTLKLRLSAKQLKAVRKALKAGKRAKVQVTVRATDAAGNAVTRELTIKVKR